MIFNNESTLWGVLKIASIIFVTQLVLACKGKEAQNIEKQDSIQMYSKTDVVPSLESEENFVCELSNDWASFPGGEMAMYEWIDNNLHYPSEAKAQGIQGRVFVKFIVEADGTISNVQAVRGPNQQLIDEAIRVVKAMPK